MIKEEIVGLDIGTSCIKAVQLLKSKSGYVLAKAACEELEIGADEKAKVSALRRLFSRAKISRKEVNISIEGPSIVIRNIQLPKMTEAELKNAIKYEAEKYIPYSINDVFVDSHIFSAGQNDMSVLLVAAKKELVNDKIQLVNKAGLQPWVVDVDSFALFNLFNLKNEESDKTIALLDIGNETTGINIIRGSLLKFTRNIPVGGSRVTEALAQEFDITLPEAEELKRNPQDKKERVDTVFASAMKEMAVEIKSSFDYYESQYEEGVGRIFLSGGVAANVHVADFLSKSMEIEVKNWSIFDKIDITSQALKDNLSSKQNYFAVAAGLALRKL